MARVTVEDCVDKIENRFDLVLLAAHRARLISSGQSILVDIGVVFANPLNKFILPHHPRSTRSRTEGLIWRSPAGRAKPVANKPRRTRC